MELFDKLEKVVTETGQSISRKVKDVAEVTRLKNMLRTCETVMDQNYREIGKAWFEAHKDEEDNEYADECQAIRDAQSGAESLRQQIDAVGKRD